MTNGHDALQGWLSVARDFRDAIPKPFSAVSARFVQRMPRSLHAQLIARKGGGRVAQYADGHTCCAEHGVPPDRACVTPKYDAWLRTREQSSLAKRKEIY
jgi:hypothetical protein